MRVFTLFYLLAYSVFFAIGYWNSSRQPPPSVEFQIMHHLEILSSDKPTALLYRLDDSRLVQYSPVTGKITASPSRERGTQLDFPIDPALLTMIGGASIGLNIDAVAKSKVLIRVLNRATGKSKTQRMLGTIMGAITGYSLGRYFGEQASMNIGSESVVALLRKDETWKSIESQYALYRLDKLEESLNDLPEHIHEKYAPTLTSTRQTLQQLRSLPGNDFTTEMTLVLDLEKQIAPHFNLLTGTADNYWGSFLQDISLFFNFFKWASLLMISVAVLMWSIEGYKSIRAKASAKRKKR